MTYQQGQISLLGNNGLGTAPPWLAQDTYIAIQGLHIGSHLIVFFCVTEITILKGFKHIALAAWGYWHHPGFSGMRKHWWGQENATSVS